MCGREGERDACPWNRLESILLFGIIGVVLRKMLASAVHQLIYLLDKLRKASFEQERIVNFWNSILQVCKDQGLRSQYCKYDLYHETVGIIRIKFLQVDPVHLNNAKAIFIA
jgi:hypothetical protein